MKVAIRLDQIKIVLTLLLCAWLLSSSTAGQSPDILTNIDVVTMIKERMSLAVIKAKIRSSATNFDTSSSAISQLKKLGVPESIVVYMIEHGNSRIARPATSESSAHAATPPADPTLPQTAATLGPKRPGIPRIGIVTTVTTAPLEQDEAIRAQFYEVLYGNRETSSSEAILMKEKLDRNIASEAVFTRCDYLLYISLDSTIESATERRGNFLQKSIKAAAEGLGAASKLANPLTLLTGITYKSHQMADSLQTSTALLSTITNATKKNDKIGINFKLVKVPTNEVVISQTLREVVAQKKKEPILQNLLIQLGNDVVNSIPVSAAPRL